MQNLDKLRQMERVHDDDKTTAVGEFDPEDADVNATWQQAPQLAQR